MRAQASFTAAEHDGALVLEAVRSPPPFSIRKSSGSILLASSAAAPVGGDELHLRMRVREGSTAKVGSVAAMVILPGPSGETSTLNNHCAVERNAHLDWWSEPAVSVDGSDHHTATRVDLEDGATCRIIEEVSLGRRREPSGHLALTIRVQRSGKAIVHHSERFGPTVAGAGSAVSIGGARHVLSAVLVGVDAGESRVEVTPTCTAAWLPVAPDAATILAVGLDRPSVLDLATALAPELIDGMG